MTGAVTVMQGDLHRRRGNSAAGKKEENVKKFFRAATATRLRKMVTLGVVIALVGAGSAVAWTLIYSGTTGSGGGKFSSNTAVSALTLTPDTSPTSCHSITGPSTSGDFCFDVTNAASVVESLAAPVTDVITTTPEADCASHLTVSTAKLLADVANVAANSTQVGWQSFGAISADATIPQTCAGDTINVAVTGASTP